MPSSRARSDAELAELSPEGAIAGRVFALVLIASGVGFIGASWADLWKRCGAVAGTCVERAAGAMIVTILSAFACAWGVGILLRIRRRVLDPEGSSRYVWGLGLLFAAGLVLVAIRIPAFTCARGRFDELLELCMHPPTTSDATSWIVVKDAIAVAGLVGGLAIAAGRLRVRLTAPVAVAAWLAGAGWSAVDVFVRRPG